MIIVSYDHINYPYIDNRLLLNGQSFSIIDTLPYNSRLNITNFKNINLMLKNDRKTQFLFHTTHTSISNILFNLDKMFDEYEILNIYKRTTGGFLIETEFILPQRNMDWKNSFNTLCKDGYCNGFRVMKINQII